MTPYLNLVESVLKSGVRSSNRTGVDTLSLFSCFYQVDLQKGFPLLTTKKVHFNSILHELLWYLSGEEHIVNLREKTKIWNDWANQEGQLQTAYGRFWRRYPVPQRGLTGEKWSQESPWTHNEPEGAVFDQIQFIIDSLNILKKNPQDPRKRRLVVSAWHPGNAAESLLPPCHYSFCFHIQGEFLNCHLTQRSGDIALGIPFNLGCYALLTLILAKMTHFTPGIFAHTIVDAHIYTNHIAGLKKQLNRVPKPLPTIEFPLKKNINDYHFEDFTLIDYNPYPGIKFEVAV